MKKCHILISFNSKSAVYVRVRDLEGYVRTAVERTVTLAMLGICSGSSCFYRQHSSKCSVCLVFMCHRSANMLKTIPQNSFVVLVLCVFCTVLNKFLK